DAWSRGRYACSLVAYVFHVVLEFSLDKVLLEIQESSRSLNLRSYHLVSHRQNSDLHSQERSNFLGQFRLAEPLLEKGRSEEVGCEIPVSDPEPCFGCVS